MSIFINSYQNMITPTYVSDNKWKLKVTQ